MAEAEEEQEQKSVAREALAGLAAGVGAGLAGTVAITIGEYIEGKVTGRGHGHIASQFVEKVTGLHPHSREQRRALDYAVHYLYGGAWGGLRGAGEALGARGLPATLAHWLIIDLLAKYGLPAFRLTPPPQKRATRGLVVDALLHGLYAFATAAALKYLRRR